VSNTQRPPQPPGPPRGPPPGRGGPRGAPRGPRGGPRCTFFWVFNNSPIRDKNSDPQKWGFLPPRGRFQGPPPGGPPKRGVAGGSPPPPWGYPPDPRKYMKEKAFRGRKPPKIAQNRQNPGIRQNPPKRPSGAPRGGPPGGAPGGAPGAPRARPGPPGPPGAENFPRGGKISRPRAPPGTGTGRGVKRGGGRGNAGASLLSARCEPVVRRPMGDSEHGC